MTDDPTRVAVLPVPEGSIVWLHNIDIRPRDDDEGLGDEADYAREVLDGVRRATSHDRFVVLCTNGGGVVEVLGPDELVAKVRAALDEKPSTIERIPVREVP